MESIIKIFSVKRLALLIVMVMITLIGVWVQNADAPPLELLVLSDDVPCYQIDESGRITDSYGRLRGWIRGGEVYTPGLELKYRFSGSRLKDTD